MPKYTTQYGTEHEHLHVPGTVPASSKGGSFLTMDSIADRFMELDSFLDRYEPISLDELKESDAGLLSRKERKFLMNKEQFHEVLSSLPGSYRVLEVDGSRTSGYRNTYYDTDSFLTYLQHHNGKANRYKLRVRHYLSSGETYLEIKQKRNTGSTIKKRIPLEEHVELCEPEPEAFLCANFPYDYREFHPVLLTRYTRVTLVANDHPERITFDTQLSFHANGEAVSYPELVIGEIKHNCPLRMSAAGAALHRAKVRSSGFSKYCIGIALTRHCLKHNRFKPKLMLLDRLCPGGICIC